MPSPPELIPPELTLDALPVRLGQVLQLAGLVESGAQAKRVVADGLVEVDGVVERRRGRQLRGGELVSVPGRAVRLGHP